jgi:hypothetical protein
MSEARPVPLPQPPLGFSYYKSEQEILAAPELLPYQHLLLRAWEEMSLTGVLTLEGIPTVYVQDEARPLTAAEITEAHHRFWNQGVATILLLRDPKSVRVLSAMCTPTDPAIANEATVNASVVETIKLATLATWAGRFYLQLATGHYYAGENASKFNPQNGVDAYLLNNLAAVRDELSQGSHALEPRIVHALLGRLLFSCYLCDRGIVELKNYFKNFPGKTIRDLISAHSNVSAHDALYGTLFPALKREFNSSLFDEDLGGERDSVKPTHIAAIRRFLNGDQVRKGQRSLGFWAYNFKFIPVETISSIYENFLEKEGSKEKRKSGAYYTPRFLAEMALDIALDGIRPLRGNRFLDPACGSGIFLVLLFNRLAAEWRAGLNIPPSAQSTAVELGLILGSIHGVDKKLTACRIACFSLYIAYLDQFNPPEIRAYMLATGAKLPSLLRFENTRKKAPDIPVVWERDFFDLTSEWKGQFHIIIGNPPWAGRGKKQVAHEFMMSAPMVLAEGGRGCLLLPSKVFLNQTDAFQSRWLQQITLEQLIQLADYRFILFNKALCPCTIARFKKQVPNVEEHEIEYITPKVSLVDLRDGVIPVAPADRKWIPLRVLLRAAEQSACAAAWKSHFWGTRRDLKLLNYFFSLPRLGDLVGKAKGARGSNKRWREGQGFQPLTLKGKTDKNPQKMEWPHSDKFVTPDTIEDLFAVPEQFALELGPYLTSTGHRLDFVHRRRNPKIYEPPLVLLNQGFSAATFFDYRVRFQHSLQSFSGDLKDADYLLFLTAFLRSKVARYFVFHTAANVGTERDKVHMPEVSRLPFCLPDHNDVASRAPAAIVAEVVAKIRRLKKKIEADATMWQPTRNVAEFRLRRQDEPETTEEDERKLWLDERRDKSRKVQAELEPYIYEYFGLNEQEIALVEDTCDILDKSVTPVSLDAAAHIPTLRPVSDEDLDLYASMLTGTINEWASGALRVTASGGIDEELGLALIRLSTTKKPLPFKSRVISPDIARALDHLQRASTERTGSLAYLRSASFFDGSQFYLLKPALRGQWTRTAALNDAADYSSEIMEIQRGAQRT